MGILDVLGLKVKDEQGEEAYGKRPLDDDYYEEEPYDDTYEEEPYDDEYYDEPQRRTLFGSKKEQPAPAPVRPAVSNPLDQSKVRVLIYKPLSYEDTQNIIDNLKEKKSIVVNLDDLDTDVAQRILDFISGAVYALNGSIRKAARNIFVIAPFNVDVSSNNNEDDQEEYPYQD